MRDLNPDLQSLVDAARDADGPRPDDRERVRRALAAQIGGAALLASTAATSSASAAGATSAVTVAAAVSTAASLSTKLAVVALLVAGGVGTAALTRAARPRVVTVTVPSVSADRPRALPEDSVARPSASVTNVPTTEAVRVDVAPARIAVRPRRDAVEPSRSTVVAPRVEEAAPPSSLVEELSLLRAAQGSLRSGGADRALDLLSQHASRFPDGALREERLALRVVALCDSGRRSEARAAAEQFVRGAPNSVLVERVRASCAGPGSVDSVTGADPSRH